MARRCGLRVSVVRRIVENPQELLGDDLIHCFLCSVASHCGRRVAVPRPNFILYVDGMEYDVRYNTFGDVDDYEVALLPIHDHDHWTLVIHVRGGVTLFLDPSEVAPSRIDRYSAAVRNAICALTPEIVAQDITFTCLDADLDYNRQQDAINCGFFICLYAESFLMNGGFMFLTDLDILTEKLRILRLLRGLLADDRTPYEPRPLRGSVASTAANIANASIDNIALRCLLLPEDVAKLTINRESPLCRFGIHAYLCTLAVFGDRRVAVVDPAYTAAMSNPAAEDLGTSAIRMTFGDVDDYEVLFVPVCRPGRWSLAIYERHGSVTVYDCSPSADDPLPPPLAISLQVCCFKKFA